MEIIQKRWFHATTKECWNRIKKEGLKQNEDGELFLARNFKELLRMIYLPALFLDLRKCEIVLSVRYTPNNKDDDYNPKWWEMIVRKPIPPENIVVYRYL